MSVTSIAPPLLSSAVPPAGTATGATDPSGMLSQNTFLQLLTAQLKGQDPLNPISDTDFLSQLSQLSTLQSTQSLNTSISSLLLVQQLTQGANLIGKKVTYQIPGTTTTTQGIVDSVQVTNGQAQLMIGGNAVAFTQVQKVEAPPVATK